VLFSSVVYQNVELIEFLDRLIDRFPAKICIAHIATNQDACASLFFDLTFGFIRVLVFLEVTIAMSALFRERDCNGAADAAVATGDDATCSRNLPLP
jgi:hypothetical protein